MSNRARLAILVGASLTLSTLVAVTPATAAATIAADLPGLLRQAPETSTPAYNRDRFEHWIDADGDGCNTRYEVLIEESTTPVTVGAGCSLTGGTWVSPYDGYTATMPAEIEIDHVVALAEAWRSGASSWTDEQRRAFANDLDVPYALTAASTVANQSKSDKDPAEWLPSNPAYTCEYVIGWSLMKYRWSLAVDPAELSAIQAELAGDCGQTAVTLPEIAAEPPAEPAPPQTVIAPFTAAHTRIGGPDRYAVAVGVSQRYSEGVPVVYIAKGSDFPDALSAAAAGALIGGPVLLTPTTSLHPAVAAELARLKPRKIVVTGSEGSISRSVFNQLTAYAPEVIRAGGVDRYEAGRNIVKTAFTSATTAFVATGRTFADALAATGAAGKLGAPVILVDGLKSSVPPETMQLLEQLGVTTVYISGGPASVSDSIRSQLQASGRTVERFGGADRYEVAAAINTRFFGTNADTGFFATGLKFPDALAGAAVAGRLGAPLFVTATGCLPRSVKEAADRLGLAHRVYLGGPSSVSETVVANIGCLTAGKPYIAGWVAVDQSLIAYPGAGWTPGTAFSYAWYANGAYVGSGQTLKLTTAHYNKTISVAVTGTLSGYTTVKVTTAPTPRVVYPNRTTPIDTWTCPSWAPIKGNARSGIYHMPNQRFYNATNPEECFRTEAAAQAAGYRKSKV